MAGYTRTDTTDNIANNKIANADDLDNEFNAIQGAFNATTGHVHDGTTGNGGPITKLGPAQDLVVGAGSILPKTNNTLDLGSTIYQYKDLWIDGTANIDALVADTADINAGTIDATVIGATTPAAITGTTVTGASLVGPVTGNVTGNLTGDVTSAGTSTFATVDINGGAIDGTAIGATSHSTGKFTTLQATGAATLGSTLDVTGAATLSSTLAVSLAVTLSSTLNVTGMITGNLTGNVTGNVTGNLTSTSVSITGGSISGITDLAIADGGTGASTAAGAITNLGITATAAELNKLAGTPAGLTSTELGYVDGVTSAIQGQIDGKVAKAGDSLTGGFTSTTDNDGTFTTGTYTPTPVGGNFKNIINGGAFTLAAPSVSGDYTLIVQVTNNASAGTVTFSGFTRTSGDALTTTNTSKFFIFITKCNGFTLAVVQALQ